MMIPSPVLGLVYAIFPIFLILALISVFQMGFFFNSETSITGTDPQSNVGIFDSIEPSFYLNNPKDKYTTRNGRCGVSFIVMGLYFLYKSVLIFIPSDPKSKSEVEEDSFGNIWEFTKWKRFHFIFYCFIQICICVALLQFSFSPTFSLNV